MMLRKDETIGTYATGGIASLRSKWTGPRISKMYVSPLKFRKYY